MSDKKRSGSAHDGGEAQPPAERRHPRRRLWWVLAGVAVVLLLVMPLLLAPRSLPWSARLGAVSACRGPVISLQSQQTRELAARPYMLARCLWNPGPARTVRY